MGDTGIIVKLKCCL